MKMFFYLVLLSLWLAPGALVSAQTIPDELAIVKARFLKAADGIAGEAPTDLNGKYLAGLQTLSEKKQAAGELDALLAIKEEIGVVEKTGNVGTDDVPEGSGLAELRKIYLNARLSWSNGKVDAFGKAKKAYQGELKALVADFTKAGRIDEALMVRSEEDRVAALTVADFGTKAEALVSVAVGKVRAGQVRGFGRLATSKWNTEWKDFDLTPLQQYSDFVDVAGSPYVLLFRRTNGDVLDIFGKTVGRNAAKLIASGSQGGYVDGAGMYHEIADGPVPPEALPLKSAVKYFGRRMAVKQNGDLVAWGGQYDSNERRIPDGAGKNIKQAAMFYDEDFALTESGELFRWNEEKVIEMKPHLALGIEKISIFGYTGFALSKTNDLYHLNGNRPPFWKEKAKNIICRGEFAAIMDMEDRWHLFAHEKKPRGNELAVLEVVMNRPETIDVEFSLYFSDRNNNNTASYAVWIEETGAEPLPKVAPATRRKSGAGFFGVELD